MIPWRRAVGFGLLAWLIPFAVALLAFPLRESARPLFESIMAVTVTGTAVGLGLAYMRRVPRIGPRKGLLVGVVWFAVCVLVDAPLMLIGGPMRMSLGAYFADIGLTYVVIPLVTWGLGVASVADAGARRDTGAA